MQRERMSPPPSRPRALRAVQSSDNVHSLQHPRSVFGRRGSGEFGQPTQPLNLSTPQRPSEDDEKTSQPMSSTNISPTFPGSATLPHTPIWDSPASFRNGLRSAITGEMERVVRLSLDLAQSVGGDVSSRFFGFESRLFNIFRYGAHHMFPYIECLMMTCWEILREHLEAFSDPDGKGPNNYIVQAIDAMNRAFEAIRSLIYLGMAYQSANDPSDSEYASNASNSSPFRDGPTSFHDFSIHEEPILTPPDSRLDAPLTAQPPGTRSNKKDPNS